MPRTSSSGPRAMRLVLTAALCAAAFAAPLPFPGGPHPDGAFSNRASGLFREAHAAVSILMTLDEMVGHSTRVVVAEPVERTSRWEELAGGRRIVTYTRLVVDETVAGAAKSEVWVRTLGGKVDKIGQHVSGEASFTLGERALVFLEDVEGTSVVTGMAQGHFRLIDDGDALVLRPSPDAGTLLPRRGPSIAAREVLTGARLDRARAVVIEAWKRRGPRK